MLKSKRNKPNTIREKRRANKQALFLKSGMMLTREELISFNLAERR